MSYSREVSLIIGVIPHGVIAQYALVMQAARNSFLVYPELIRGVKCSIIIPPVMILGVNCISQSPKALLNNSLNLERL
jgi:hypothetical protein